MEITQEIHTKIDEILGGEWFNVFWAPDEADFQIVLDGDFTIDQLEKLIVYLKGLKGSQPLSLQ